MCIRDRIIVDQRCGAGFRFHIGNMGLRIHPLIQNGQIGADNLAIAFQYVFGVGESNACDWYTDVLLIKISNQGYLTPILTPNFCILTIFDEM